TATAGWRPAQPALKRDPQPAGSPGTTRALYRRLAGCRGRGPGCNQMGQVIHTTGRAAAAELASFPTAICDPGTLLEHQPRELATARSGTPSPRPPAPRARVAPPTTRRSGPAA